MHAESTQYLFKLMANVVYISEYMYMYVCGLLNKYCHCAVYKSTNKYMKVP